MKAVLTLLLVFGLAACDGEEAPTPEPPPPAPPPVVPPPPEPPPAGDEVPSGNLRGDAAAGAKTYQLYCSTCHGTGGKGDGLAAPKDPKPADHTDPVYMGSLSDAELHTVITKGGAAVGKSPLMAPWGAVLNPEQTRDVIAYVRSLSGT